MERAVRAALGGRSGSVSCNCRLLSPADLLEWTLNDATRQVLHHCRVGGEGRPTAAGAIAERGGVLVEVRLVVGSRCRTATVRRDGSDGRGQGGGAECAMEGAVRLMRD